LLELLILVVLAAHLWAMNLASAGPLLCIGLRGVNSESLGLRDRCGQTLAWWSLTAMAVGMVTGGALIFAPPTTGLHVAMGRFPTRAYWFAAAELVFSLGCLLLYVLTWNRMRRWRWLHAIWAILSATNLLYHFPPLMIVLAKLAANAAWSEAAVIPRPTFLVLMRRGDVLSLTSHFALSSIAVAAVTVLWLLARATEAMNESDQISLRRVARGAAVIALLASVLQLPVGIWVLSSLPSDSRNALLGENILNSSLFVGGVIAAMLLLHRLGDIALGEVDAKNLRRAGWLLAIVVLLMTATLHAVRKDHAACAIHGINQKSREEILFTAFPSYSHLVRAARFWKPPYLTGSFLTSSSGPPGSLPAAINSA